MQIGHTKYKWFWQKLLPIFTDSQEENVNKNLGLSPNYSFVYFDKTISSKEEQEITILCICFMTNVFI